MDFLEYVGLVVVIYYLFYLICPWFLDCDVTTALKERFGKPIESLQGKVVWITGASSGIGEHLAYPLARAGCKLVLTARRETELRRVKDKCLAANGNLKDEDVEILVLDICKFDEHEGALKRVIDKFGKLDILVSNAGRSQRAQWEKIDLRVDRAMFDLNVFSVVSLSRLALKYFLERGHGHLAVTSSMAGILGIPFSGTYTGSKHALHGYFESLRTEQLNKPITVTLICPGATRTPFLSEAFTDKPGEKFGQESVAATNKISAERCGELIAVALANELGETWIAQPVALQLAYLNKYYPNLGYYIMSYLGPRFMQHLRDSKVTVEAKQ